MNFLVAIASSAVITLLALQVIHILQLDGYQIKYSKKMRTAHAKTAVLALAGSAFLFGMYACYAGGGSAVFLWLGVLIPLGLFLAYGLIQFRAPKKKPLVFTARATRLIFTVFALTLIVNILLYFAGGNIVSKDGTAFTYIFLGLPFFLIPFWVYAAALIVRPVEYWIAKRYVKESKRFFAEKQDLIKIGITGSYGKTSVKFILEKMLQETYHVVATPASYNTPMGISRSLELITDETEIFIAEMGARHPGDIKELCEIVGPAYAILTGVTGQHLETFKDIETVQKTKFELVEALPKNGFAVFNGDNEYTLGMQPGAKCQSATASLVEGDCTATNIVTTPAGSEFDLIIGDRAVRCNTMLVGRHNILNIAMAAMMAYKLGVSLQQISHAICQLEPVPHRLEIMRLPTGITIIDDSYNSNEKGFETALETLQLFEGRKVVVSPGLVELGGAEQEVNRQMGTKIAEAADIVFCIGERGEDLMQGLLDAEFDARNIFLMRSLDEAQKEFSTLLKRGDIVLMENDLPENY